MKSILRRSLILLWMLEALTVQAINAERTKTLIAPKYDIAAYYFPGFHVDPRNEAYLGTGYTEWRNIKAAKPGYEGHFQPRVPLWDYQDEALPAEMDIKINAAADHGVNTFIFDWYWYGNKPFLERALNDGYLKAKNRGRVKFYLMWANHDWLDIFPLGRPGSGGKIFNGAVDRATFDAAVDHVIKDYFMQPSYYKIDGEPVFSIYELGTLISGLGGIEATKSALNSFRTKVKAAGFPGLHLQGVIWGNIPANLSAVPGDRTPTQGKTIAELAFSSLSTYTWTHYVSPQGDYIPWAESGSAAWKAYDTTFPVQYFPNVTISWDTNPRRTTFDPNLITGNTPNRFARYLWKARAYLDKHPERKKLIVINSWNEWPEGSYLEPDTLYRMEYLEAVQDVFNRNWGNVAAATNGGRATASSTYSDNYPERAAIDGERIGTSWGQGGGWNDATEDVQPDWLQVDFSGPKSIGKIEVFTLYHGYSGIPGVSSTKPMGISMNTEFTRAGITDFIVKYWDGAFWKTLPGGEVTENRKVRRQFLFKPIVTSKIRLEISKAMDGFSRVTEFEAWGRDPVLGCTDPLYAEFDSTAEMDNGSCASVSLNRSARNKIDMGSLVFQGRELLIPHTGVATLEIYNSLGQSVKRLQSKTTGVFRISKSGLVNGIYWLRIIDGKETRLRRLVIL
jgi:hypothetical protein